MATKIGIVGAHSTGKSTFIKRLQEKLERRNYRVETVAGFASEAQSLGFPILQNHTFESTAWVMARGTQLELEADRRNDIVLVDRAVPDALGYYRAALEHRSFADVEWKTEHLTNYVRNFAPTYDVLVRTVLDTSLPIDPAKCRDMDEAFRRLASKHIETVFTDLNLDAIKLPLGESDRVLISILHQVEEKRN